MKLYTKTGDGGETSLAGGTRVSKTHPRIEACGNIDELNSNIGYLISLLPEGHDVEMLESIQHTLFAIGCNIATDKTQSKLSSAGEITAGQVLTLEQEIDNIETTLPKQNVFILPGGSPSAAWSHVCRSVCRRAERRIAELYINTETDIAVMQFINRLSDYFFILSRKLNADCGIAEKKWHNTCG